jgi:hypothetical protein
MLSDEGYTVTVPANEDGQEQELVPLADLNGAPKPLAAAVGEAQAAQTESNQIKPHDAGFRIEWTSSLLAR